MLATIPARVTCGAVGFSLHDMPPQAIPITNRYLIRLPHLTNPLSAHGRAPNGMDAFCSPAVRPGTTLRYGRNDSASDTIRSCWNALAPSYQFPLSP
jgi:hypothetical protein